MGERYSVDLYFEIERLEEALRATAEFTVPYRESTSIVLPCGREMVLPFSRYLHRTSDDEDRIIRSGELGICVAAVLRFPVDAEIDRMSGVMGVDVDSGTADLGMFDLYINVGWHYAEFSFQGAWSLLSILLRSSSSIHQRFQDLLREAGGVAGIIDVESEDGHFLWLDDPERMIHLDRRRFFDDDFDPDQGGTDYDVDGFTAALLGECDRLRERVQDQPS